MALLVRGTETGSRPLERWEPFRELERLRPRRIDVKAA
jgi:hypothetical protein